MTSLRRQLAKFLDSPPGLRVPRHRLGLADPAPPAGEGERVPEVGDAAAGARERSSGCSRRRATRGGSGCARGGCSTRRSAAAARPSPALRAQIDADRGKRIAAELARLGARLRHHGRGGDARELPGRLRRARRATSRRRRGATALPPLVDSPPMTLDDELAYTTQPVGRRAGVSRDDRLDAERAAGAGVPARRGARGAI